MNAKTMGSLGETRSLCAILGLITLLLYWPATRFDFTNYDDPDYVTENPVVQQGLTTKGVLWALTSGHASNWHPVTWISHELDCQIFGLKSGSHHLTSIILHAGNVVLLFLLLAQTTGARWRSALTAALFGWHPLHVESVAWVAERKDVLSTFFLLLTMLAYWKYTQESALKKPVAEGYYRLALICYALGLLAKPMLVTLPLLLFLFDVWPLNRLAIDTAGGERTTRKAVLLEKVPFVVLAVADSLITFWVQKGANSVISLDTLPFSRRIATSLVSYVLYLADTFWPAKLAVLYPYPAALAWWQTIGAALILAIITFGVIVQRRTRPYLVMGWFWFLVAMVPVIGLVQVGIQFMADRYTYVSLVGIFVMLTWSIPEAWFTGRGKVALAGAAGLVLAATMWRTTAQLQYWRNSLTLFGHALEVTQNNIRMEYDLGEALARRGRTDEARRHYEKALAMKPTLIEGQYDFLKIRYNLGLNLAQRADWQGAESNFVEAIKINPAFYPAHNNLGSVLRAEGKLEEAIREYGVAVAGNPGDTEFRHNLAQAQAEGGKLDEAILNYEAVLKERPVDAAVRNDLGVALAAHGDREQALAQFSAASQINPRFSQSHLGAGEVLLSAGKESEAKAEFATAKALYPGLAQALADAAKDMAAHGRYQAAVAKLKGAAELDPENAEIREQLDLYRGKQSSHQP